MNQGLSEVTQRALALAVSDRILLAQTLWDSLGGLEACVAAEDEVETLREAGERNAELSRNPLMGRSHHDVIDAARKAMQCE